MADTETDLLIRIKTILDTQGVAAARKAIDDAARSGNQSQASMAGQARQAEALRDILGQLGRRGAEVRDVYEGMSQAMRGGSDTMFGLAKVAYNLWDIIRNINPWVRLSSIVLAVGAAIWAVVEKFAKLGQTAKKSSDDVQKSFEFIAKANLEKLKADIAAVEKSYDQATASAKRLAQANLALNDAKLALQLAEIEAGPGTEEEKTVAKQAAISASDKAKAEDEIANINSQIARERAMAQQAASRAETIESRGQAAESAYSEATKRAMASGAITADEARDIEMASPEKRGEIIESIWSRETKRSASEQRQATSEHAQLEVRAMAGLGEKPEDIEAFVSKRLAPSRERESSILSLERAARRREAIAPQAAQAQILRTQQQESEANVQMLSFDLQTAVTRRRTQQVQEQAGMPKPSEVPEAADVAQSRAARDLLRTVAPKSTRTVRDIAGQPSPQGQEQLGITTQERARQAIRDAGRAISRGAEDQIVFDNLIETLTRLGAVVSVDKDKFAQLLDSLDGKIGEIKARQDRLESQARANRSTTM